MILLEVGGYVNMATHANGKRQVGNAHLIEVGTCQVGSNGAIETILLHQGVESDVAFYQVVVTVDIDTGTSVMDIGHNIHAVEVPAAVAQMGDIGIGLQRGAWREDVGALTLGFHIGRNGIDGVVGHEMVDIEIGSVHRSIVSHEVGIDVTLHLDFAATLIGCDIVKILGSVGLYTSFGTYAGRYAVVALHIARQNSSNKA